MFTRWFRAAAAGFERTWLVSSLPSLAQWRTSSYSAELQCVQCASGLWDGSPDARTVAVRDSQHPHKGQLNIPAREWTTLLGAVRQGEF